MTSINPTAPLPATDPAISSAIREASRQTKVDFDFLLAQARVESALDPEARASTSSATGLYQFIESTWLRTLHRHGDALGQGELARHITLEGGRPRVADPAIREHILSLRTDPQLSALMAGALAQDHKAALTPLLGRAPDMGELYLAHFLGVGDAKRFLAAHARDPGQHAANLFAQPAAANRSIFYDGAGRARSLEGVLSLMQDKMASAGGSALSDPPPARALASTRLEPMARRPVGMLPLSAPPLPPTPAPAPPRMPMSDLLRRNFSLDDSAGAAGNHIRRAYERLSAFGL